MTDRPMDHGHLEILPEAECWRLLAGQPVGRIAFRAGDEPAVLPVNHVTDDDTILFRTAGGGRYQPEAMVGRVAFEVDGYDAASRTGWSVLVHGTAESLSAAATLERLGELGHTLRGDAAHHGHWLLVRATHVSGRRIPQRPD